MKFGILLEEGVMKRLIAISLALVMVLVATSLIVVDIQKLHTEKVNRPQEDKEQGMILIPSQVLKTNYYEKTLEVSPDNGQFLQLHLYCYGNITKYAEAPADFKCYKNHKLIIKKTFYSGVEKYYTFKIDKEKTYHIELSSPYGDCFSVLLTARQFD